MLKKIIDKYTTHKIKLLFGLIALIEPIVLTFFDISDQRKEINQPEISTVTKENNINKKIIDEVVKETQDLTKVPSQKNKEKKLPNEIEKKTIINKKLKDKKSENLAKFMPKDTLEKLHKELINISNTKKFNYKELIISIRQTYDIRKMLRLIVGPNWFKVDKYSQSELISIFEEYIAKNYIRRFVKINNLKFSVEEIKQTTNNYYIVKTNLLIDKKQKVVINYLLTSQDNSWKIFDVLLDGTISEIATKKSEFKNFINNGDIANLINALRVKNKTLLK